MSGASEKGIWREEHMVCPLAAAEPLGVIRALAGRLVSAPGVRDAAEMLRALESREAESPTYLGSGLALPHARTAAVDGIVIAAGTSPAGVRWGPAGEPAHLILLIGVPRDEVRGYLALVSRLTKAARSSSWVERLAGSTSGGALAAALCEAVGG